MMMLCVVLASCVCVCLCVCVCVVFLLCSRSMTLLLRLFLETGCQRLFLNAGDMLYTEGDRADGMYIIISGRLRNLVGDERRHKKQRTPKGDDIAAQLATPTWRVRCESDMDQTDGGDEDSAEYVQVTAGGSSCVCCVYHPLCASCAALLILMVLLLLLLLLLLLFVFATLGSPWQ